MSTSGGGTNIEVNVDASQAIQSFERLKTEYRELLAELRKGSATTGKGRGFEKVEAQRRLSETAELEAQALYESDPEGFAHLEPTGGTEEEPPRSLTTGEAGTVARGAAAEVDKEIIAEQKLIQTIEEKKQADREAAEELKKKAAEEEKRVQQLAEQTAQEQRAREATARRTETERQATVERKRQQTEEQKLSTTAQRLIQQSTDMSRKQRELGVNSGINASAVFKLRIELERLIGTERARIVLSKETIASLNQQQAKMKELEAETAKLNNRMTFMKGSTIGTQNAVRGFGAAAQGSMLGLSAMNGDVMGLAFSLIFLQFSALLPVTLGVAALAVGGGLAFKWVKKLLDERKKMKELGNSFFIVTRSMESIDLARERAAGIVSRLNLEEDDAKHATDALVIAQQALRAKGIEPTTDALRVALDTFLIARATGQEFEEAIKGSTDATVNFADSGIPAFNGVQMSMEELKERGGAALNILNDIAGTGLITVRDIKKEWEELGNVWPDVLRDVDLDAFYTDISNREKEGGKWALWSNDIDRIKDKITEASGETGWFKTGVDSINSAFGEIDSSSIGEGGVVDLNIKNFQKTTKEALESNQYILEIQKVSNAAKMSARTGGLPKLERKYEDIYDRTMDIITAHEDLKENLDDPQSLTNYLESLNNLSTIIPAISQGFSGEGEGGLFRHGGNYNININVEGNMDERTAKTVTSNIVNQITTINDSSVGAL